MKIINKQEVNLIMNDFNNKFGKGKVINIVGEYDVGDRNNSDDKSVEFC